MEVDKEFAKIGAEFGIGIVGLGEGEGLVRGLHGHPELRTVGVCDVNAGLAQVVAETYNVPYYFADVADMVANPDIHIVVIYTPDHLHLPHIRIAMEAGKHVICTKPLVNSLGEAREMVEILQRHPRQKLMVGQSSRFFGPFRRQRSAFDAGELGDISFAEAHYTHDMRWFYSRRPWAQSGAFDLLFACVSHPVDLVRWYMGDVDEVFAYADRTQIGKSAGFHGNDVFTVNLKFASGRIARVLGLYGLEHPHQTRAWIELSLYGSKGTYIAKYPQLETIQKLANRPERVEHYFEETFHHFQFEGIKHHAGEFANYTQYFAQCLVQGCDPSPNADDGFKTIAVLESIRESTQSGMPISVRY